MRTSNLDEIVFRDRNQKYGAYELRKRYDKTVIISFLVTLFIVSGIVGVPMVQAMKHRRTGGELDRTVIIDVVKPPSMDELTPPPPPPPPVTEQIKKLSYEPFRVVDTSKLELSLIPNDELLQGDNNEPVPEKLILSGGKIEEVIDESDKPHINPAEFATFRGGDLDSFRAWVQQNLVYPAEAAENGIAGKVIIQFCISKKGELEDIRVQRSVDKSIDEETIRVLKLSPLWNPAKQGGTPVKQLFTIPVSFLLQN